jgi:hypothetical protein
VVFNITGANTHWAQNFTQFYIAGGGSDLTINSVVINSPTSATVDLSISPTANPGARSVYMVTNGESLTDSGAFVVTGGVPVITYLSPAANNAAAGTSGLEVDHPRPLHQLDPGRHHGQLRPRHHGFELPGRQRHFTSKR